MPFLSQRVSIFFDFHSRLSTRTTITVTSAPRRIFHVCVNDEWVWVPASTDLHSAQGFHT